MYAVGAAATHARRHMSLSPLVIWWVWMARPWKASRLVAKVDSAAVRDGFDLYLHGFIVTDDGHCESRSSWRDFLSGLKQRGLFGVEFVVSDGHPGPKAAIREVLPEAVWQRCYVHFLRNALDYVPRRVDDDCLMELRWFYDRRDLTEVRRDLVAWLAKWPGQVPEAVRLGGGQHRGDADLLPATHWPTPST
jgi:Transposase, Mutator family